MIVVSWNVKDLLRQCLQSLLESDCAPQLEIVVVDNASHDGSTAMVQTEFPQAKLIASQQNLGFAQGNNVGVAAASGDFIFLLNPDTKVAPAAIGLLRDYLQAHPAVGTVGPQLRWPDGAVQSSRRRFPTVGSMFWESTLLEQWWPQNRVAQAYKFADQPDTASMPVDWVVGAALFIRRGVWEAVGPIDEAFFMYFEETDWCRRCVQAGWEIHYVPAAQVVHYEGQSSQQVAAARTVRFQRSKIRYARKWLGPGWAMWVRLFLLLTFAWQWGEETLKWLIGHKRALRRDRMRAYWQVLRSGLTLP